MDILRRLFNGPRRLINGLMISNCLLGITSRLEKYLSKPEPHVSALMDSEYERYNKKLMMLNSSSELVSHIFRSPTASNSGGRIQRKFGVFFRYFDNCNYNYGNHHLWTENNMLFGSLSDDEGKKTLFSGEALLIEVQDNVTKAQDIVVNPNHPNLNEAFALVISRIEPTFPKSALAHLARHRIQNHPNSIRIEFYCKAKACGYEFDLVLMKEAVKRNAFFITTEANEVPHCIHVNGYQQQSTKCNDDMELTDFTKVGETYSNVLTMANFITDNNIDQVISGLDKSGIYNLGQLKNKNRKLKAKHHSFHHEDIDCIDQIAEQTFKRDLIFNNAKETAKNQYYFGEIQFLQWVKPMCIMMYNYVSLILWAWFICDIFIDFTESIVLPFRGDPVYNLCASVASPLGGIMPWTLFETLCTRPNGYTVKLTFLTFFQSLKMYTGSTKHRKHPIYVHCDRFGGFLYGCYHGFEFSGHHFNYLRDGVKALQLKSYSPLEKYPFRVSFCECHVMLGLGTYTNNIKHMKKKQQWAHLAIVMELHRYANYSLDTELVLGYLNLLKLILTAEFIDMNGMDNVMDLIAFEDVIQIIEKHMDKEPDFEASLNEYNVTPTLEKAKMIHDVKTNVYDWDANGIQPHKSPDHLHNDEVQTFLNDESLQRLDTECYVFFKLFRKYPWIYASYHKETTRIMIFPPMICPTTMTTDDNLIQNFEKCDADWENYQQQYLKFIACTSHVIIGSSLFRHDTHAELTNRFKKNQQHFGNKLSIGRYVAFTAGNRERIRRQVLMRQRDQVARTSWKELQDGDGCIEDEDDGITLKNKNASQLEENSENVTISRLLIVLKDKKLITSAAECHRTICTLISENESNYPDIETQQTLIDLNKQIYGVINKLLRGRKVTKPQQAICNVLKPWLLHYMAYKGWDMYKSH